MNTDTAVPPGPTAAPAGWRTEGPTEFGPILTAALTAFRQNGFHGTSVRDIARRVGVTVPALYYHHENKEAILVGLLDPAITALVERCSLAVHEAGDDPALRLFNQVECLMLHATWNAKLAHLDTEIHSLSDERRLDYVEKRRKVEHLLRETLELGVSEGVFAVDSAKESARAILGMVQSVSVWFNSEGSRTAAQVAGDYVLIAARTAGASPDVLARARTLFATSPRQVVQRRR